MLQHADAQLRASQLGALLLGALLGAVELGLGVTRAPLLPLRLQRVCTDSDDLRPRCLSRCCYSEGGQKPDKTSEENPVPSHFFCGWMFAGATLQRVCKPSRVSTSLSR